MKNDSPFLTKTKVDCECPACDSKFKVLFFEDDAQGEVQFCPFCGGPLEEFKDQQDNVTEADDSDVLYTDDPDAYYQEEIVDDDDPDR